MINNTLTSEEVKSMLPFYSRAKTAYDGKFSAPISYDDFTSIRNLLLNHGYAPPSTFACSSCVLWCLETLYRVLTDVSNRQTLSWYLSRSDSNGLVKKSDNSTKKSTKKSPKSSK